MTSTLCVTVWFCCEGYSTRHLRRTTFIQLSVSRSTISKYFSMRSFSSSSFRSLLVLVSRCNDAKSVWSCENMVITRHIGLPDCVTRSDSGNPSFWTIKTVRIDWYMTVVNMEVARRTPVTIPLSLPPVILFPVKTSQKWAKNRPLWRRTKKSTHQKNLV